MLVERGDEPTADALDHVVGVALHHRRQPLELLARRGLAWRLHRAEHALRALGQALQRLRVLRVDRSRTRLRTPTGRSRSSTRTAIASAHQPLAHPRHRTQRRVHHLVQRDVEAEVVARERPLRLERVDVRDDEAQGRLVAVGRRAGGEREVVAPERVLREVPDHRARLHAEQRGREHRIMLPMPASRRIAAKGVRARARQVGEPFGASSLAVVLLHGLAERAWRAPRAPG